MKFHPEARAEYDHEVATLENARSGYGVHLVEALEEKVLQAKTYPDSGHKVRRIPKLFNARQFTIQDFGLSLIVVDVDGVPQVIAVAPGRKRPLYWRDRLETLEP